MLCIGQSLNFLAKCQCFPLILLPQIIVHYKVALQCSSGLWTRWSLWPALFPRVIEMAKLRVPGSEGPVPHPAWSFSRCHRGEGGWACAGPGPPGASPCAAKGRVVPERQAQKPVSQFYTTVATTKGL